MADNSVYITGAEQGAFTEALSGLPQWATEDTAHEIQGILSKSLKVQEKSFAELVKFAKECCSGNNPDTKKANDELNKYIKNLSKANEEAEKTKKRQKKHAELEEGLAKTTASKGTAWLQFFGLAASVGSKVLDVQKQYFVTSSDLFKSGVNMLNGNNETTSSMEALRSMITQTGLRLETLQDITEKHGSAINAVGMKKFSKAISESTVKMNAMGFSAEEGAELIATLIETQSLYGDIRNKSDKDISAEAIKLGANLNTLSLQFGISISKLRENLKAMALNTDSMVVNTIHGRKAADNMALFGASLKDTAGGNLLLKLAASEAAESTSAYGDLARASLGNFAQQLTNIVRFGRDVDPMEAQRRMQALVENISLGELKTLQIQKDAGNQHAAAALDLINTLKQQYNTSAKAAQHQTDAAIESQASLSRFSTELEKTAGIMQRTFPLAEKQVDLATSALKLLNDTTDKINSNVDSTTRSWVGLGLSTASLIASFLAATVAARTFAGTLARGSIGGKLGGAGGKLGGVGAAAGASVLGKGALLAGSAAAGWYVGSWLRESMEKSDWGAKVLDDLGSGMNSVLAAIGVQSAIEAKESIARAEASLSRTSSISVPTTPKPSTVISPSADKPGSEPESTSKPTTPDSAITAMASPAKESDINSIMARQSLILAEILDGTKRLVSLNTDILRYTRTQ